MNENIENAIPVEAIAKGRSYGEVLEAYMRIWEDVTKVAYVPGKPGEEIFSDTMAATAYRLYLLGVEDGMKEVSK